MKRQMILRQSAMAYQHGPSVLYSIRYADLERTATVSVYAPSRRTSRRTSLVTPFYRTFSQQLLVLEPLTIFI
jgi:hypothetical protein